ncbi:hypothetical protein KFK09_006607 [Dendrobium nobile]|uniref:Uncharacterized protein n=1 Tax=Dendrobium nobile TaxID=94219 RepID=A0A8T3BPL5_DENNO|nr:hypothetical protein KFK09_006607 [Dendrobium nobile]
MDDVVNFLSGEYGIRQPGKSIPMAASKPSPAATLPSWNNRSSKSGKLSNFSDGVLEENIALPSSKKDYVLESLGMGLTETKGLGFEELVYGNKAADDPFLVFEMGYPSFNQSSVHSNVISSASVDERDFFDVSGAIGRSKSSFASEGSGSIGKVNIPSSVFQNPSNVQKCIVKEPLQSSSQYLNTIARPPNPPMLGESFEFFSLYENAADEKERAATTAKHEKTYYNGIEAFFSNIGLEGNLRPVQMEAISESIFDAPFEMQGALRGAPQGPAGSNLNIKESSSMNSRMDDLSFGIGAFQSPSKFQDIDGDNEHRRQARYERERKKIERAEKALSEKIEHDFELQREKKEREMIAEELDIKVKQWAAGREGNLRALISTLQDVLWPECEWKPVSLGNLMTSASVKKAYGKAALCIHPDKVQQKGATLRQKFVAEKVFYLLTEALNKFSSEELS